MKKLLIITFSAMTISAVSNAQDVQRLPAGSTSAPTTTANNAGVSGGTIGKQVEPTHNDRNNRETADMKNHAAGDQSTNAKSKHNDPQGNPGGNAKSGNLTSGNTGGQVQPVPGKLKNQELANGKDNAAHSQQHTSGNNVDGGSPGRHAHHNPSSINVNSAENNREVVNGKSGAAGPHSTRSNNAEVGPTQHLPVTGGGKH